MIKLNFTDYEAQFYLLNDSRLQFILNNTALDKGFQRPGCWKPKLKEAYCTSVVLGNAPSPIVVVNIEKSIKKTIPNSADYKYFKSWQDAGYKWISIDGNNRTVALREFFDNRVTIKHGKYMLSDIVEIDDSNDKWATLPDSMRDHAFDNVGISIVEYTVSTRDDLSILFVNINQGESLSKQEIRNARLTPIASEIRELGQNSIDALKHIFPNNKNYVIDEMLVKMACYYAFDPNHGVKGSDLNEAYEDNSPVWPQFIRGGGKECIIKTINLVKKYGKSSFSDKSTLMNLFIVMTAIHKKNQKVLREAEFFDWFITTESRRIVEIAYTNSSGEAYTYATCCRNTNKRDITARHGLLMRDLDAIPDGLVSNKLDERRLFTKGEKRKSWEKQGGKCPECGKECPESEIYNSELWHGHHQFPHSLGGQTTQDNCVLLCADCNLKLGNDYDLEAA